MIRSYEVGVLFLPSVFESLERPFSLTPNHPLFGTRQDSSAKDWRPVEFLAATRSQVERAQIDKEGAESSLVIPFPLPYSLPPVPYSDGDRPWCWDVGYRNGRMNMRLFRKNIYKHLFIYGQLLFHQTVLIKD